MPTVCFWCTVPGASISQDPTVLIGVVGHQIGRGREGTGEELGMGKGGEKSGGWGRKGRGVEENWGCGGLVVVVRFSQSHSKLEVD